MRKLIEGNAVTMCREVEGLERYKAVYEATVSKGKADLVYFRLRSEDVSAKPAAISERDLVQARCD